MTYWSTGNSETLNQLRKKYGALDGMILISYSLLRIETPDAYHYVRLWEVDTCHTLH